MAWLPASLLKHTGSTTMRVRFVCERRRYATVVQKRHGFATLNSNNSVVYDQKHKVWARQRCAYGLFVKGDVMQQWCKKGMVSQL